MAKTEDQDNDDDEGGHRVLVEHRLHCCHRLQQDPTDPRAEQVRSVQTHHHIVIPKQVNKMPLNMDGVEVNRWLQVHSNCASQSQSQKSLHNAKIKF